MPDPAAPKPLFARIAFVTLTVIAFGGLVLGAYWAATAEAPRPGGAGAGVDVEASEIGASATAFKLVATPIASPSAPPPGRLELVAAYELTSPLGSFGGLSGMLLDANDGVVAVSDRGTVFAFELERGPDRVVTGLRGVFASDLRDDKGRAVKDFSGDSEAMARGGGGEIWISYERDHRITGQLSPVAAATLALPIPAGADPEFNGGVEGLAVGPDQAVYAILEAPLSSAPDKVSGFRFLDGEVAPIFLDRGGRFSPTGADFAPDGSLLLLERFYSPETGVEMQIRRFAPDALARSDLGAGEILALWTTDDAPIDNMEAISAETGPDGRLELIVLSDDNFNPLQRTVLLQLREVD